MQDVSTFERTSSWNLPPAAPDDLLALMQAFRDDPRPEKLDLGVGVYRDEKGRTPLFRSVAAAEHALAKSVTSKVYEGPFGNQGFCRLIENLVFGGDADALRPSLTTMTTVGGTGALAVGLEFLKNAAVNEPTVWFSDPTWPNHRILAEARGLQTKFYAYASPLDGAVQFDAMISDLSMANCGDILLVQGVCHNPSGVDFSEGEWDALLDLVAERDLNLLVDVAYHGLGDDLEQDILPVRRAAQKLDRFVVTYSCAKNFGLYRERAGAVLVKSDLGSTSRLVAPTLSMIAGKMYAMPPAHGAAIVETILSSSELTADWHEELGAIRSRLSNLRVGFAELLEDYSDRDCSGLKSQKGMFTLLPIRPDLATPLAQNQAIYLPQSGRLNIAGLQEGRLAATVAALAAAMRSSPQ